MEVTIRNIKRKMSDLQKMTIEEQKKAVLAGYDMDIIPTDLATYGEEAKNLLQDLQSRNERMFLVTVLVENIAPKRQKLFNDIFAASGVAQKYNCDIEDLRIRLDDLWNGMDQLLRGFANIS